MGNPIRGPFHPRIKILSLVERRLRDFAPRWTARMGTSVRMIAALKDAVFMSLGWGKNAMTGMPALRKMPAMRRGIVKVPGIDAIQLGPYDLSASMGRMGQIDDTKVVEAIDRVVSASRAVGLPVGCFGVNASAVRADIERGCTLITVGVDAMILGSAAEQILSEVNK